MEAAYTSILGNAADNKCIKIGFLLKPPSTKIRLTEVCPSINCVESTCCSIKVQISCTYASSYEAKLDKSTDANDKLFWEVEFLFCCFQRPARSGGASTVL